MATWSKISSRGNVEDRRGMGGIVGGGISLTGLAIILLVNYLGGGNIGDVLSTLVQPPSVQTENSSQYEGEDSYEVFASEVLGSANDVWSASFKQNGRTYHPPKLVLFRNSTASACGGADSRMGPHYCPEDQTIYLDETFFDELTSRLGAEGGDVAEAYVIAHEVGHHVQHELGTLSENASNADSIQTELQADCFAGIWAHHIEELAVFEPGEIHEAMDAAAAVGDDRVQAKVQGRINPETWTHGSSNQRTAAFDKGYENGTLAVCQ